MSHSRNPGFQEGNNWAVCDSCGMEFRADKLQWRWDGALVCEDDWEPRHAQDYVRTKTDQIAATSNVRSEPEDQFVTVYGGSNPAPDVPGGTFDNNL